MDKCMRELSLLPNPGKEWMYYCNTAEDVLQQGNAFDCGVFLCIYARALSLGDPLIVPDSLPDAWLMMIAELHLHQLGGIPPQELQPESYYAVDYINKFYIGRLLAIRDGVLHFKFLHSNQCKWFNGVLLAETGWHGYSKPLLCLLWPSELKWQWAIYS